MAVTREVYLELREDGFKYDMINGVLHMSPSAFFEHNDALSQILRIMGNYLSMNHDGKVVVETDVFLPDNGDVLRPDITVILKNNYGIIKGHIHGVPDIVVEILSESTSKRDLGTKADRYLSTGVKEYWIANPDEKTISLWINDNKKSWNKKEGDHLVSSVLSGFVLHKGDVFAG